MANLSNINGKFLFTDGDFLLIDGATANSISATESGVAIKNSNAATLSLQNSATNGKNHTLCSTTDGSFNITDVGVATRFTITSGGDVYFPETLRLGIGTTSIYPQGGDTILKLYSASGGSSLYLQSANTGSATTDGSKIYIGTTDLTISNMEGETRFFNEGSIMMNISKFDGSANANPLTSSNIRIWTHSKTGWLPGDILSKIEFYSNDVSGIGARNAASIRVVNEDGDGSTTTTFSGALAFYTSAYNSTEQEAMRIDSSGNVGIGDDSPTSKLTILGTSTAASNTPSDAIVDIHGTSTAHLLMGVANVSPFGAWINTDATGQPLVLQGTGGNVGIGTASPDITGFGYTTLTVVGGTSAGYAGVLELGSPTTNANGQNLGIIAFMDGSTRNAQIDVTRESSTSTSNMHFYTNGGSGIEERMRITSGGDIELKPSTSRIKGGGTTSGRLVLANSDSTSYMVVNGSAHTAPHEIYFVTNSALAAIITSAGRIKAPNLGGFTPTGADLRYDTSDGEIYYQTSSERYKTDIVNLESSLDKINTLRPVRYNDIKTGQPACGLIAEETVDVIPEVVFKKEIEGFDEPQIEGLNYSDLIPFLIKSIQELKAEVEKLRTQINN